MDKSFIIQELQRVDRDVPNPYTKLVWYPSILNGNKIDVRRTKPGFLHIRRFMKHVLKTPTGEVLRESMEYSYFRANMNTGEIVEL